MSPARRFLAAGLAVAAAEAALGLLTLGTTLAAYFFGCAAASAALAWAGRRLFEPPPDDPSPGGGSDDPPPPPWWPDFESAFARHVRDRERSAV